MTDNIVQDEMRAARQDMAQLLNDIVIAPLKDELDALLNVALFPLDKEIKDRHDGLMAQISKIKRTLDRHYPATSLALDDQFQALLDGQHDAEQQAQARTNHLATTMSAQAEALSQQTLQALSSQTESLDGLLSEQMSGLADSQQSAETLAVARAEHLLATLSTQAETLGQQAMQALYTQSRTLEGQLNNHHQAFQLTTQTLLKALSEANQSVYREGNDQLFEQLQQLGKERTKRLEALIAVLVSKGRTSVAQAIAQQEQRVQATLFAQSAQASAQHEAALQTLAILLQRLQAQDAQVDTQHDSTLQTLAVIHQHVLTQNARVDDLQAKLRRTAGHAKVLLYTFVPVGLLSLGALAYLILRIG